MSETVERRLIEGCWGDAYSASSDGQIWSHRGHPFDEANTYRRQDRPGNRECRACRAAYSRRAYVPKGLRP